MLLKLGDKGENVTYLQYGLHILCCSPNGFDGEFGNSTFLAVKKFQSKFGLISDGVVGDFTWNTLRSEIKTIQNQLNKKGVNVGTADGIAGPNTYKGVISFQEKNKLSADGQVGPATWDILFDSISGGNSYNRLLKVTSPLMYGDDIKAVQNKLNSLGYMAGTADGYYGTMTKNAVIKFQQNKKLEADGVVGPSTWNYLFDQVLIDILKKGSNLGLYSGVPVEFEHFNVKSIIKTISLIPHIYVQGELALSSTIPGPVSSYINISYSPGTIASNLIGKLNEAGVEFNFDRKNLELSISKLTVAQGINDIIKYNISVKPDKTIEITFEAKGELKSSTTQRIRTFYQRITIIIKPDIIPRVSLSSTVPLVATSNSQASAKFNPLLAIMGAAAIVGVTYVAINAGALTTILGTISKFFALMFPIKDLVNA